jgi:hypothetical protein
MKTFADLYSILDSLDGDKKMLVSLYSDLKAIKPALIKVSKPNSASPEKMATYDRMMAKNSAIAFELTNKKDEFQSLVLAKLDKISGIDGLGLDAAKLKRIKFDAHYWAYQHLKFSDFFVGYLENLRKAVAKLR